MPQLSKQPEKSQRPVDSKYWQQRLTSWDPVMTPCYVILMLVMAGMIFLPVGLSILYSANSLYSETVPYTYSGTPGNPATQQITFTLATDTESELNLFYEITRYHQNNIKYSTSVSWEQMQGNSVELSVLETKCGDGQATLAEGSTTENPIILNPCGLIAKSFFMDSFTLTGSQPSEAEMSFDQITGPLDTNLFKQPQGFQKQQVTATECPSQAGTGSYNYYDANADDCTTEKLPSGCKCMEDGDQQWLFYYPDDATTEYLYESYPDLISPLEGVTDAHFMNWMNIAALPKFRKLYGVIQGSFQKGQQFTFTVTNAWEPPKGSTKSLILTASGTLGIKNPGLGLTYIVSGSIMLFAALVFFVKHEFYPRPLGSPKLLHWNR